MHRNRLLFLDTEFTGLDKDQDHLVQVAWVMTDLEGNITYKQEAAHPKEKWIKAASDLQH